ncbi:Hypothetical protein A7982_03514 [Minicystis rosea]|nr:Hypothetical protein A7982_03514 [Minicystis rosea]
MPANAFRRLLAGTAALAFASLAAASCTSVLSLGAYDGASDAICGLLDGCYTAGAPKTCRIHIDSALIAAGPMVTDQWLHTIGKGCLDNCSAARLCLDLDPVCVLDVGDACTVKEDCCHFSDGSRDCGAGRCCVTAGQHCNSNADCCPDVGTCDPERKTCGGTVCRAPGTSCDIDEQCCSGHCRDHQCSKTICEEDGFPCQDGASCCSGYCDGKKCGEPKECGLPLAPCSTDTDCCPIDASSPNGICFVPEGAPRGLCTTGQGCLPNEGDCGTDGQCCSGHCDRAYFKCGEGCRDLGVACEVDDQCCSGSCVDGTCQKTGCSNAYCDVGSDCCSGNCVLNTCAPACVMATCADSVCAVGPPLAWMCNNMKNACIKAICDSDPYCCCTAWDSFCVLAVAHHPDACLTACP